MKKKKKNSYSAMLCIAGIALALMITLMFQSHQLENKLASYEARAAELTESIEEEEARTEEISELKEYMTTEEYAEEVAREKLGLVKGNEIVFEEE
ncbi:MAG: septum formation initiator family protein [Clostridiales bacterium]|nr:septum formation initiator family protein [Clostridiales bacterium]